MCTEAPGKLCTAGPLYKVMVMTPAKDSKVPKTLAIPWGLITSTASSLHEICIKKFVKSKRRMYTYLSGIHEHLVPPPEYDSN